MDDLIRKAQIRDELIREFETSLDERVNRSFELDHQWITGAHHFSEASAECIRVYRDGHFIATVMMSHAINEAIIRFIGERNGISRHRRPGKTNLIFRILRYFQKDTRPLKELLLELEQKRFISRGCCEASQKIMNSFRADVHHMNPPVSGIDFGALAKTNMERLTLIEKEIFDVERIGGSIRPKNPQYWDTNADGTVNAYLRISH